jgi:hypothetical protein
MVSKLDHPHIVQLRTFSIEHNIPYLVMAYEQGCPSAGCSRSFRCLLVSRLASRLRCP